MKITIVGAGPAGSWASILLARRGHQVTLIDPLAPWEKPCGGGVTAKALTSFGIFESDLPRNYIQDITIYFGDESSVSVSARSPIAVISRRDLGKYLFDEAQRASVAVLKARVTHIAAEQGSWRVTTRDSEVHADFLIGADGATSLVRRSVGHPLVPEDLCVTVGYFIPSEAPPHMKIFFVPSLDGYIWSFPRPSHLSYGLITRSEPGWNSRAKQLLSNFVLADLGPDGLEHGEFYSAPVPCLSPRSWKRNQIAGNGWALIGDAAGFADPITGEGIYSAFKSAQLLAETIDRPDDYPRRAWTELSRELARASHMYQRFYHGSFLGGDFKKRTIQLSRRSRTLKLILADLIAGNQSYLGLKKKLFFAIPRVGWELIVGKS